MTNHRYDTVTVITAEPNKFLKLIGVEDSEELIGRPERVILSNSGKIPEFEEVDI